MAALASSPSLVSTTGSSTSKKSSSGMGCGRPGYITCSICSATKYYSHVQRRFGQFSCEPCSKFMKRFLRDPKKFTCYESGQCLIGRPFGEQEPRGVSVSRCKACWLKICLDKFTIEQTVRDLITDHYLPVFHGTNGPSTMDNNGIKPIVPTSGLYAPGTAILLGQNHNLTDLPVIPIPVRKRKVKGQPHDTGHEGHGHGRGSKGHHKTMSLSGKNGPPIEIPFENNGNNYGHGLISNSANEVLIRSPTSLSSSSTSIASLPGSIGSSGSKVPRSPANRRNGQQTSVKYKNCGNSSRLPTNVSNNQIKSRNTIKAINHDIDDNVFRPIQLLNNNPGHHGQSKKRKLLFNDDQISEQTIINDPVASLLVYGDHDYNGLSLQTNHLTTDEDEEVEGHFNHDDQDDQDDQRKSDHWSRKGGRTSEEDYIEESENDNYEDDEDGHSFDDQSMDDDHYNDDDHHDNDHRKRKRRRRVEERKINGAKRGLNDVINQEQNSLNIDPKAPIIINREDIDHVSPNGHSFGHRRTDPESPKAATRVEDLNCHHDLMTTGSNTDIGSMIDLTSDFPKTKVKRGRKGKNDQCPVVSKSRKSPNKVTISRRKKKLITNQSNSSSGNKYIENESDLNSFELVDVENVSLNHEHNNNNSARIGTSFWSSTATSNSNHHHDNDQDDNDLMDNDNDQAEDEADKYYRELIDPTLRDYQRESSLLFEEILNTNSPFL